MALIIGILLVILSLVFFLALPMVALIEIVKDRDESTLGKVLWLFGLFFTGPIAASVFLSASGSSSNKRLFGRLMLAVTFIGVLGFFKIVHSKKVELISELRKSAEQIQVQPSALSEETKTYWSNDLKRIANKVKSSSMLNAIFILKSESIFKFYQNLVKNSDLNDNDYNDWGKLYQSCDSIGYKEIESFIVLHNRKVPPPAAVKMNAITAASPAATTTESAPNPPVVVTGLKIKILSPEMVMAATQGNLVAIQAALQNNLDVNAIEPRGGGCMLHIAAHNRQFEVFKFLVDHGANINQVDHDNSAPIHYAAYRGDLQTLKFLIDRKAILSEIDKEGLSPLGYAKFAKSDEKIKALIDAGAK